MDAADSLVGESFAVLLLTEQATILLEPCVELLDITGGEFAQWDLTQIWDNVLIDPPFIRHLGVWTEVWLFMGLVP